MSDAQTPVRQDHPMMVAWNEYHQTDQYKNSRRWAAEDAHVDGSLWAAFVAGWTARRNHDGTPDEIDGEGVKHE